MSRWLRLSTAQTERIGPFLDKTDGVTEETALGSPATEISKDGGAFGTGPTGTHDAEGWYSVALTTTHTNTLGSFIIKSHAVATHLPVWHEFMVVPAVVYDALVAGTGTGIRSDLQQWLGAAPNALVSSRVDVSVGAMAAATVTAAAIATDAIDDDAIATGAIAATAFAAGAIDAAAIAADAITSSELATTAVNEIRDAILSDSTAFAGGNIDAAITTRATPAQVGTEITNANLQRALASGTADSGSTTTLVDDALSQGDADYWEGGWLVMTSGNISGQARKISAFAPGSDTITVDRAFTQAVATQTYEIWPSDFPDNFSSLLIETDGMAHADIKEWLAAAPNALASGRVDASVGAMAAGTITAAVIATDAIDDDAIATGAIAATAFVAGAIDAAAIAANAIGASELATDAVNEIRDAILSDSTAFAGANIDATVSSRATPAQVATELDNDNLHRALVSGTADSGSTTTLVDTTALTQADTDYWKGAWLVMTSGNLIGQARKISAFNFTTDTITVDRPFTQAVATQTYEIWSADFPDEFADLNIETDGMVHADVKEWLAAAPNALISGRVDASVGAMAAGTITASAIATAAIDADAIAADAIGASELATDAVDEIVDQVWDELRSAHVGAGSFGEGVASVQGNVTGSVASVTGAVGSIASGGIVAATFAAGAIDAGAIATDAIGSLELATTAVNEIRDAILSDSTSFAGANIDATISSRATPAQVGTEIDNKNLHRALVSGTSDSGTTTTLVDDALTQADTDFFKGGWLVMTSGNLLGQARKISDFNFTTDTITVDRAFTQAVATQTYEIWPADFPDEFADLNIETDGVVHADVKEWLAAAPNSLVSGRVDVSVGAMAAGTITASAIGTGAIDADAIAADAIGASELATDAVNEIRDSILSDATTFAGANINATITSRATPAQVNTEVIDVLRTDTVTQISAIPAANAPMHVMIQWLYACARNKIETTATQDRVRNDGDSGNIAASTISDDATTFIRGKYA